MQFIAFIASLITLQPFSNDAHMLQITGVYDFCSLAFPMAYIPILITTLTSDASANVFAPVLPICGDTALGETKTPVSPGRRLLAVLVDIHQMAKPGILVGFPRHLHIATNLP